MTSHRPRNEESGSAAPATASQWRLQSKLDRRFRAGHPWVYSNELTASPKGVGAGERVKLADSSGQFIAWGYGNPHSLISFRLLSRNESEFQTTDAEFLLGRLQACFDMRQTLGLTDHSYRLCFGEADRLPGLVIDRFLLADGRSQVFAVQPHTAGADRWMDSIVSVLERLTAEVAGDGARDAWAHTTVIERADLSVRKLEGLEVREPRILKEGQVGSLEHGRIRVQSPFTRSGFVLFDCDLREGQKTGFFLDQRSGTRIAGEAAQSLLRARKRKGDPIQILDLCSYVGQWSVALVSAIHAADPTQTVEVILVDISTDALNRARANVERLAEGSATVQVRVVRQDVFDALQGTGLEGVQADIVIADPPALIKGRKDLGPGSHAYLQLNTGAMKKAAPGALYVACSCSSLFEEEPFIEMLAKASLRSRRGVRWFARSFQGPDHPTLAEFPEGRYLKTALGWVEKT